MGRKAGVDLEVILQTAVWIADRDGLEAASLGAVARELGIKTPSLYNHVDGLDGLRRQMALRAADSLTEAFRNAVEGLTGTEALMALAGAHRSFAMERPGLYQSLLPAPLPEDDAELYNAMAQPVALIAGVLGEMGVDRGESVHLIRTLRAVIHGFVDLEMKGGYGMPVDVDVSYQTALRTVILGIEVSTDD